MEQEQEATMKITKETLTREIRELNPTLSSREAKRYLESLLRLA
jgi:hypothetical protein